MVENDMIASLEGKYLDIYVLIIKNRSLGRFPEETNFDVFLKTSDGIVSNTPVIRGKYFAGRGKFYRPWLEIYYESPIQFNSTQTIDLSEETLDEKLFKHLSQLLPPGSHMMVAYSNHPETRKGLDRGVPPPVTALGYLLWTSGFTWFKNWYYSEGFWEGDVKLQGNKPLNSDHRKKNLREIHKDLTQFLKRDSTTGKIMLDAKKRAQVLMELIERELSTG